ncbi:LOW QUALITY PROTEIN: hypothetical protein QTO34_001618 [Cnephaeus nilssonii]|uniref:Uncharacterized protein n=1 Tax=Cnephaeus nilssonii TaxID=3371016 RepID=A0AA40HW09_CNENI|nr:LOW QUALITY PROTEIN: hypothetical protein QTO34_001618 [Eptesicus nilssonii]
MPGFGARSLADALSTEPNRLRQCLEFLKKKERHTRIPENTRKKRRSERKARAVHLDKAEDLAAQPQSSVRPEETPRPENRFLMRKCPPEAGERKGKAETECKPPNSQPASRQRRLSPLSLAGKFKERTKAVPSSIQLPLKGFFSDRDSSTWEPRGAKSSKHESITWRKMDKGDKSELNEIKENQRSPTINLTAKRETSEETQEEKPGKCNENEVKKRGKSKSRSKSKEKSKRKERDTKHDGHEEERTRSGVRERSCECEGEGSDDSPGDGQERGGRGKKSDEHERNNGEKKDSPVVSEQRTCCNYRQTQLQQENKEGSRSRDRSRRVTVMAADARSAVDTGRERRTRGGHGARRGGRHQQGREGKRRREGEETHGAQRREI